MASRKSLWVAWLNTSHVEMKWSELHLSILMEVWVFYFVFLNKMLFHKILVSCFHFVAKCQCLQIKLYFSRVEKLQYKPDYLVFIYLFILVYAVAVFDLNFYTTLCQTQRVKKNALM